MLNKQTCYTLAKAIKEAKWLDIQYRHEDGDTTRFWFAIDDIVLNKNKQQFFHGILYNITKNEPLRKDAKINPDRIVNAVLLEHSTYPEPVELVKKIEGNPITYHWLGFEEINRNILAYYLDCNLLDNDPYQKEGLMVEGIDLDVLSEKTLFPLNDVQEKVIHGLITKYNNKNHPLLNPDSQKYYKDISLVIALISILHKNRKYVIAYQNLYFDPSRKALIADTEIQLNQSFVTYEKDDKGNTTKETLRLFGYIDMDAGEFQKTLMKDRSEGIRIIHDGLKWGDTLDTRPEIMVLERSILVNLKDSYQTLNEEYVKGNLSALSYPIRAFFGNSNLAFYRHDRNAQVVLLDRHININQMNVVYKSMRYPINYVKGPPGTGKTQTLVNVILSAVFSGKTVMVTSGNNKPVDGIRDKLRLSYGEKTIPFPCLRLGNGEKTLKAMEVIEWVYQNAFKSDLTQAEIKNIKNSNELYNNSLYGYMKRYEAKEDSISRYQKLKEMLSHYQAMNPSLMEKVKNDVDQLDKETKEFKELSNESVSKLFTPLSEDKELQTFFYDLSLYHLSQLHGPKYEPLLSIIKNRKKDPERSISAFNHWISNDDNLALLLRVFPVILTTNISSSHLGSGKNTRFDLVIMDEAGQCNVAQALLPIMRGNQLLLVGDTSQLKPVVLLNENDNRKLMEKYHIPASYSYLGSSIMSTMRANDQISNYIMLKYHYRCGKKIINYSNQRYYNNEMNLSQIKAEGNLELVNVNNQGSLLRNANENEAYAVVKYIQNHHLTKVTVLTPFVNQEALINEKLNQAGLSTIHCGTIHSMQGAEDDVILFSPSVSEKTTKKAYDWLANNAEIINVGVTRAKKSLVIIGDKEAILKKAKEAKENSKDDLVSLVEYVSSSGTTTIEKNLSYSECIGYSNHSTFEDEFYKTMLQYCSTKDRIFVRRNVKVTDVLKGDPYLNDNCHMEYDEVVFQRKENESKSRPVVAIEINGMEHYTDPTTMECDLRKKEISAKFGLQVIKVKNEDVQDYESIKEIINSYLGN